MAKCSIQTEINKISESSEAAELLFSIGIDIDEESGQNKLKTFLSMALSKDNYQMFLEKQKQTDAGETIIQEPESKEVAKTTPEQLFEEAIASGSDTLVTYQKALNKAYEDKNNTEDEKLILELNQDINMYKTLIKNEKAIISIRKNNTLTSGKFAGELHSDYRYTINNYNNLSDKEKQFYSLSELKDYATYDGLILSKNSISDDIKNKILAYNKNNSENVDIQNFVLANVIKNVIKNKNKSFKERYGITKDIEDDIDSLLDDNKELNIDKEVVKNINKLTSDLVELPFAQNIKTIINSRLLTDDTIFSTIEKMNWNEKAFEKASNVTDKQINGVTAKININGIVEVDGKNKEIATPSAIGLLLTKNDSSNVLAPTYLKNLIKTHGLASLGEMYKTTAISEFDDNFDDVWGIKKGDFDVDRKYLESLLKQGYIPQSMVVNALGMAIYKDLPIKFNRNVESELASKLVTELGLYAIHVMEKAGIFLEADSNIDKSITIGSGDSETTQTLIRLNIDSGYTTTEGYADGIGIYQKTERINGIEEIDGQKYSKGYKEDLVEVSKLVSHLYELSDRPRPSMTPLEPKFNRTVRNGFQKVSEDTNRILNDYESRAQTFKPMTSELFKIWKGSKNLAYSMVGIGELSNVGDGKNANGNKFNIEDAEAQASKYNNERLEFDDLMEFYETVAFSEDGKMKSEEEIEKIKFYLAWDFTVSGRYMNDSNINPQNSKITRYVVQSNEMSSVMKLDENGKFDADQMYNFKIGISQALDFGTDKSTDAKALKGLSEIVDIADDGKVTFSGSDEGKTFEAGFNYFKSLMSDIGADQDKLMVKLSSAIGPIKDGETKSQYIIRAFSNQNLGKIVKEGEGVHAITALYALAQIDTYARSKDKADTFTHSFTAEADDITSGMILTLMNVGTDQARMLIEKGGVYTTEAKEFWISTYRDIKNIVKDNNEITLPEMYKNKDGVEVLTHGFLVEFGKLLDNKRTRDNIFDELNKIDSSKYSYEILNSRVHFKDFYTTVSKEAKDKISKLETYIDNLFDKDFQIVKDKGENANKKYIQEMAVRTISEATTGEVYSTVSNIMSESNKILNKIAAKGFVKDKNGNMSMFQNLLNDIYGFANLKSSHSKHANYFLVESKNKDTEIWAKYDYLKMYHRDILKDQVANPTSVSGKKAISKLFDEQIDFDLKNDKSKATKRYRNMFIKRFEKFTFNTLVKNISKMNMNDLGVKNPENFNKFISAVNKVVEDKNKAKKDNEEFIDEYDAFNIYKYMVMQRAIIKIAGSDISRNAAKNPVMVFIYGSSINSIKKLISNTIVKESIYNKLIDTKDIRKKLFEIDRNKTLEPKEEFEALKLILDEITNNEFSNIAIKLNNNEQLSEIKFKTVNKEKGIVENVSDSKDIKKLVASQDFSGMIINNTMLNRIKQYSDNTYGDAFGTSFKELFGDAIGYREAMKGLELVRYSIFKYKLNKEIYELAKEKLNSKKLVDGQEYSYVLSENDLLTIKKKLERQGFGHSIEDSNGSRQSLNTTIKALAGTQVRFRTTDMGKGEYKSAAHQMRSETENTGASAVITIHQEDGRKIGLALEGTGMLNIYDAFYSSTNELNNISNRMNEEFLNVTGDYNPLIKSLEEIEDMIFKLGDKELNQMLDSIDINEYTILSEGMKKINPDYDLYESFYSDYKPRLTGQYIEIVSNSISEAITNETEASVGHNYLSDAAPQAEGKIFGQKQTMINVNLISRFYDEIINRAHDAYNDEDMKKLGSRFEIIEELKDTQKYKPTSGAIKNLERVVSAAISQAPNNTKLATIIDKLKECAKG